MPTERAYLVSKGLAKDGRGRFSAEAKAALEEAKRNGMIFDKTATELAKEARRNKPARIVKPKVIAPKEVRPEKGTYDVKAVRSWAEQTGAIQKGARGKIPTAVVNAYIVANGAKKAVVRTAPVKRTVSRSESVGWTYAKRREGDPSYISEPLVAVTTCGGCSRGVSFCRCNNGPTAPRYLGGGLLLLTRPEK